MNRRTALTTVATAALVALPTAAMAYDAPGYDTAVDDPTPAVGEPITLTTDGVNAGEDYTLTVTSNPASIPNDAIQIAGTASLTKTASGSSISFSVTLSQPGTYTAAVTDASGALIGDEALTVVDPDAAAGAGDAGGDGLAATGFDGAGLALGAGALVLAGAGAVVVARRRQIAQARI